MDVVSLHVWYRSVISADVCQAPGSAGPFGHAFVHVADPSTAASYSHGQLLSHLDGLVAVTACSFRHGSAHQVTSRKGNHIIGQACFPFVG